MDAGILHGAWTAALLAVFAAIVVWAWSGRRKRDFDEAARLPLEEEAARLPLEEEAARLRPENEAVRLMPQEEAVRLRRQEDAEDAAQPRHGETRHG